MHVTCHTDASIFETLASEWNELAARSLTNTPFQRAEFLSVWWRHFGHGDPSTGSPQPGSEHGLCVLTLRDSSGKLAAIAPMFVDPADGGTVRWVGGEEIADYLDLIAPAEHMEATARAVWDWLNSPEAPPWRRMVLSNTPQWAETLQHLRASALVSGMQAAIIQLDVCPVITLPHTFETYLKGLDSKQRHEINRKLRRAQASEAEVRWYFVDRRADIAVATEDFMRLMEAGSPQKAAFLTPPMRAAFHDTFATMHRTGLLQLAFLEVGGKKAAAYAQFDHADRVWVYNSGLNPQVGGPLSPGWVLLARLIEDAINKGRREYDFMQGNEEYKYRFGGKDTYVFRLVVER